MTGTLKVTPEKLTQAATEFKTEGNSIRKLTQEMLSTVNSMSGVWESDAQKMFCKNFKALDGDMAQIKLKIEEHVSDLNEMARTYKSTETTNSNKAASLKTDFISG